MKKVEIIGISRYRILRDGKDITTLIGLKGCPFKCKYCINKENLMSEHPSLTLSAEKLYERICKDDIYFQTTGGGITFGGGEPLLHIDFIRKFKVLCPPSWRINLEISLNVRTDVVMKAIPVINHYIVDIKSIKHLNKVNNSDKKNSSSDESSNEENPILVVDLSDEYTKVLPEDTEESGIIIVLKDLDIIDIDTVDIKELLLDGVMEPQQPSGYLEGDVPWSGQGDDVQNGSNSEIDYLSDGFFIEK